LVLAFLLVASVIATSAPLLGAVGLSDDGHSSAVRMQDEESVTIDSELQSQENSGETVEVLVRMSAVRSSRGSAPSGSSVSAMQTTAETTQQPIQEFASNTGGVELVNRLWIVNAALLTVDTGRVDLDQIARVDGVTELQPNEAVTRVDPPKRAAAPEDSVETTYGLEQVNAPNVWSDFDTRGASATVAVVDTGIDPDHPEFDDFDPDHYIELSMKGEVVDREPRDTSGHGTHTAGTVAGGANSGTHIGVAPDVELYSINVFPTGGKTTTAAILAGIEQAVENDVDVMNLSLGGDGFNSLYIDAIRNALDAGSLVVVASGNDEVDSRNSPGHVFDALTVGATDADRQITEFSTGDTIDTSRDWGPVAPEDWPEEYKSPDVSAPGKAVRSSYPPERESGDDPDGYEELQGTSMAAPHVTGIAALLMAQDERLQEQPRRVKKLLQETATKPAPQDISKPVIEDANQLNDRAALRSGDERDVRYGFGIVDAYQASLALQEESEIARIEGTVVDDAGTPVDGARVSLDHDGVRSVRTDADGNFTVALYGPSESQVTIEVGDAFGFSPANQTVTAEGGTTTQVELQLDRTSDATVLQDQPEELNSGSSMLVGLSVAHVEDYSIDVTEESTIDEEADPVQYSELFQKNGTLFALVNTTAQDTGTLELAFTVGSRGQTKTVTTGPTKLLPPNATDGTPVITNVTIPRNPPYDTQFPNATVTVRNPGDFTESVTLVHAIPGVAQITQELTLDSRTYRTVSLDSYGVTWERLDSPGSSVTNLFALEQNGTIVDSTAPIRSVIAGAGRINGTVTDLDSNQPIGAIPVRAVEDDGRVVDVNRTNSEGEYALDPQDSGQYRIVAGGGDSTYATSPVNATLDDQGSQLELNLSVGTAPSFEFQFEAGTTYAFGIPGPAIGTYGDLFPDDASGYLAVYNASTDRWTTPEPDTELQAFDAMVVVPSENTTATIEFAGPPDASASAGPVSRSLDDGWQFVPPGSFEGASDAFNGTAKRGDVRRSYQEPGSPLVPESGLESLGSVADDEPVNPFSGYFVFVEENGTITSDTHTGMTRKQAYDELGIESRSVEGTVTSSITGEEIPDARVRLVGTSDTTWTDETGHYRLPHVSDRSGQGLAIRAADYEPTTVTSEPGATDVELADRVHFEPSSLDVPDSVSPGEEVTVEYELTNQGTTSDEQTVQVQIGPDLQDAFARKNRSTFTLHNSEVELDPGESTTVSFTVELTEDQPTGTMDIGVFTDDDRLVGSIDVTESDEPSGTPAARDAGAVTPALGPPGTAVALTGGERR
jgi:subtilisin family serine protease